MFRFLKNAALTLLAGTALLRCSDRAMAAVVAMDNSPKAPPEIVVNENRSFGNWTMDNTLQSADGNEFMGFTVPDGAVSGSGGWAWHLEKSIYDSALGHALADGDVIRQSLWVATDALDPLRNTDTFTDSLKFELAGTSPAGGDEFVDTGALIPIDFAPTSTDPGQVTTTGWTQISMQYTIDELDFFGGTIDDVHEIRPVLFLGIFQSAGNGAGGGRLYMDRIIVEVFDDLATANATPLDTTNPGGHIPAAGVPGDYNGNSVVDAADYTVWRDNLGTGFALLNRDLSNTGDINQQDYDFWKTRFGNTSGSGAVAGSGAVPEPSSVLLALLAIGSVRLLRIRRRVVC